MGWELTKNTCLLLRLRKGAQGCFLILFLGPSENKLIKLRVSLIVTMSFARETR